MNKPNGRASSLHDRLSRVLTTLLAAMLLLGIGAWMHETRNAIHEEVEAATRVAEQWLAVLIPETLSEDPQAQERLMSHLIAVGRIRANRLEVFDADGVRLYTSPDSTYKPGRFAPALLAAWITPTLAQRTLPAGEHTLVLTPDPSRAVVDAWDTLTAAFGWATALVLITWLLTRKAIHHALSPVTDIQSALERGATGQFDIRLPEYRTQELALLAHSYNRLADSLHQSRVENARLEHDQALACAVQSRLEQERRVIARELHDELGQGITAVRAIAGAIIQRSTDQPGLYGSAQAILAMTGQMQDGVSTILQRLRSSPVPAGQGLEETIQRYCELWAQHHGNLDIRCTVAPVDGTVSDALGLTLLRVVQESLTNVVRHAHASRVDVRLAMDDHEIEVEITDDGRGLTESSSTNRLGLVGMRERLAELRGRLELSPAPSGGLCVRARIPRTDRHERVQP